MGALFSTRNDRVEEVDLGSTNAYRYPPKSGNYFSSHFIMGGERFESTQPEAYLFGENMDLNFLGGRPTPFPYPAPQPNEPTRTLRSLCNIRKESLRFVKCPDSTSPHAYNIEFIFDTDIRCAITIYYFCTEEITPSGVIYTPKEPSMNSETYHYKRGSNQQFSQASHVFDPSKYSEEQINYRYEDEIMPIVIQCVAEEGDEPRQSHMLMAVVEKNLDGTYTLKPLKQKLFVDGLCYLLQEMYGIENKNVYQGKDACDDEVEDTGSECVICMSDARDTLILPCRHLCLCNICADSLRYQANNCPICRAPFRALLQIRAVRKCNPGLITAPPSEPNQVPSDIPPGFEPVSLIEALNGPTHSSLAILPSAPDSTDSPLASQKRSLESGDSWRGSVDFEKGTTRSPDKTPETLSLNRSEARAKHKKGFLRPSAMEKARLLQDSVEIVNEVSGSGQSKKEEMDKDVETRSLLLVPNLVGRSSPISLSTPHSLHLCEKAVTTASTPGDTTPAESDYFTPEDPTTAAMFVSEQEPISTTNVSCSTAITMPPHPPPSEEKCRASPRHPLVDGSLPGTPASNASNRSSGDSFSSTSSTRHLLTTTPVHVPE